MSTTALKIVLDTNILIAIIGRLSPYRWIFDRIIDGRLRMCVSNEILTEYHEILSRKASPELAENVTSFIIVNPQTIQTPIYFNFNLSTVDPDDNKFIDCAIASDADFILSNDSHFQALKQIDFPKVRTVTLPEFESEYRNEQS